MQTQSEVKLRLYVKCRGGEEVCEKGAYLLVLFFFFFVIMRSLFLGTKSLMQR